MATKRPPPLSKILALTLAGGLVLFTVFLFFGLHHLHWLGPERVKPGDATSASPAKPGVPEGHARGAELAQQTCRTCHLFPEPDLLSKDSWAKHVLPKMSSYLGLTPPKLHNVPGAERVLAANVFPSSPRLPMRDWLAISNYVIVAAPIEPLPADPEPRPRMGLKQFVVRRPDYRRDLPMTSVVLIDSQHQKLYVGDGQTMTLDTLNAAGKVERSWHVPSPPVSLTLKPDGCYVTLIGFIYPADEPLGRLLFFPTAPPAEKPVQILDHLARPTHTLFADLNRDGREDFVVSCFGNHLGILSWFENLGGESYAEHLLYARPGPTIADVHDFNRDGLPDIVALLGQAEEGIYLFTNSRQGGFTISPLVQYPPTWGNVYFELVDFNQDGFVDLLTANGDLGDFPSPVRRYHGIRLYLNDGQNRFSQSWFYCLPGAYKARALDFDGDADLDIAAISFFPDYGPSQESGFVYFENKGNLQFETLTFPEAAEGRWMVMESGDLNGDGDMDLVIGSFFRGPSTIPIPSSLKDRWQTNQTALLILENQLRR